MASCPGSLRDCLSACSPVVSINKVAYKELDMSIDSRAVVEIQRQLPLHFSHFSALNVDVLHRSSASTNVLTAAEIQAGSGLEICSSRDRSEPVFGPKSVISLLIKMLQKNFIVFNFFTFLYAITMCLFPANIHERRSSAQCSDVPPRDDICQRLLEFYCE